MHRPALVLGLVAAVSTAFAQDEDRPVVIVNGEPIMRSSLAKLLAPLKRAKLPKHQVDEVARKCVEQLVKDVLLDQFMREKGYQPPEDEIDAEIARLRRIYESGKDPGAPSFEQALRRRGASLREMRENPTAGMRFSCRVRGRMTERDLARLFETERDGFDGTEVRVRHILVAPSRLKGKSELARRDMARQRAVELRALALAAGPDTEHEEFAKLAREHSHCASAASGGDLGFFRRFGFPRFGVVTDGLARVAFEAEAGDIPPAFETKFGFHVVKVTDRKPGRSVTLDEVRDEVAEAWAKRRGLEIYDELYRKAKIERAE